VTEKRENGQWTILEEFIKNVDFTAEQWKKYQENTEELFKVRQNFHDVVSGMLDSREGLVKATK